MGPDHEEFTIFYSIFYLVESVNHSIAERGKLSSKRFGLIISGGIFMILEVARLGPDGSQAHKKGNIIGECIL